MTTSPHLAFTPVDSTGGISSDLLTHARAFGAPPAALTDAKSYLAWGYARFIGTAPKGERWKQMRLIGDPQGRSRHDAITVIERRYGLHDEVLPAATDREVDDLLFLMATTVPARLRWAHAVRHLQAGRVIAMSAQDRFLRHSQPQDSRANLLADHPHTLPVDPGWTAPSEDDIRLGTEAHLARWITHQSAAGRRKFGSKLSYIDSLASSRSKRASTEDCYSQYIDQLAAEEHGLKPTEIDREYRIGIVSSCPHWIAQTLSAERRLQQAVRDGRLRRRYRLVVAAFPLAWSVDTHAYVAGGLFRAVWQWFLLNQPATMPHPDGSEIAAWVARFKNE